MNYMRCLVVAIFSFGLNSIFGGGSSGGGSNFTPYSPTGLATADPAWQNLLNQQIGDVNSPATQFMQSQLPSLYGQLVGNIGNAAPGIEQVASGQAAPYLANMAGQADAFHNLMAGMGSSEMGNANTVINTAFDPQSELKNSLQQQVTDASRAATSARGIGMSPEAAGIENQATSNFLMDWQNQQLSRQTQGLAAADAANTAASGQFTGSQAMSGLAPQLLMQSAQLPYQTTADLLNAGFQNAGTFQNATNQTELGPLNSIMNEIIPYMNYGAGAQQNAFTAGQSNLGNIMTGLGIGTNGFGTGAGGFGASPIGGLFGTLGSLFGGGAGAAAGASTVDAGAAAAGLAGGWIVCTELHRQGRLSTRLYRAAAPAFLNAPERAKRGYYLWAIPSTRHLRKHPQSLYSRLLDRVFNCRASYIAARRRGRQTTLSGSVVTHGVYALCWTLGWFVPSRLTRWQALYEVEHG